MTEVRPIHVRVAETLGWTKIDWQPLAPGENLPDGARIRWFGFRPDLNPALNGPVYIPRYDLDWSATGPEIEKRKIRLSLCGDAGDVWEAFTVDAEGMPTSAYSDTPLLAVCELLIKLGEAGKL